jgi:murein L,D-transpeptidase YcbB/YkuD
MRSLFRNLLIVAALAGGPSGVVPALAQEDPAYAPVLSPETETDVAIARRLSRNGALTIEGQRLRNLDALRRFYAERGFDPVWTGASGPVAAADGLVALLRASDQEGLNPLHYHADAIERRMGSADVAVQAELDLLIADAVMEYASDLRAGRLAPRSIAPELAAVPPPVDAVEIAKRARDETNLAAFLAGFTPPHPQYAALRDALRRYRALASGGGWPAAGQGPVLKPGMQDASVPALRRRLAATGDYTGNAKDMASPVYDAALQTAVKRFQSYNGQTPDGVVGESTRAALNVPAAERVNQIVANMERWRWLPDDLGERHVIVNIPGYSLRALDKGQVALRMPVIVGSVERPTPVFSHRISHLVFNPTWTIPPTVARNDILPKLLRNPAYLKEHDIKLFESWAAGARQIDSRSVNWREVGARITRYRMRQDPGPKNSLGRIKYMFPNDFDVYLHDTPARDKFAQVERSLSSGCVRVGDPAALTAFLMEGMDDWPVERRTQVLDAGETKTVWLRQSVPVHLTYQTVYFDDAGKIHFLEDIYGRDTAFVTALAKRLPGQQAVAQIDG